MSPPGKRLKHPAARMGPRSLPLPQESQGEGEKGEEAEWEVGKEAQRDKAEVKERKTRLYRSPPAGA